MEESTNTLHLRNSWSGQTIRHIPTSPIGEIYVLSEYNPNYGELVRSFQINGNNLTNVKSKYSHVGEKVGEDWIITFDASNGLLGERRFEGDSIVYEFLFKPLGIEMTPFGSWMKLCTWHEMQAYLDKNNLKYIRK